ncbi:flagellar hook-associated protein FlgK [Salinisphaera sp. T31B1]|uniref:flagellar hook-associated protein FlgK n=1 Tax=Salinisphaera sp. T31B1 TaxID=727963 RepID=UPI00333FC222
MSSLFGIGYSGLSAAQSGMSTASNNIANVNTPGYTRQSLRLEQSAQSGGQGGVGVGAVQRNYQQYLSGQLNDARSTASALDSHLGQLSQINNLLGDGDAGLAPLMQQFFAGLQTLAGSPDDAAARESLLGDANSMAAQFQTFAGYLDDMGRSVATQMEGAVGQVNNYAEQIDRLNEQITLARGRTGAEPNTLLDKRDQLVSELGQLINIDVAIQDGNTYNITAAGQPLVDATGAHSLALVRSAGDPTRRVIAYEAPGGARRELDASQISGGSLGGLVAFRDGSLESATLSLDQLAHDLADKINDVHGQGTDLAGNPGTALFETARPISLDNARNTGTATLQVAFSDDGMADIAASNYRVAYENGQYSVTRVSDGQRTRFGSDSFSIGGVDIAVEGTPNEGDSFLIKPLAGAAAALNVSITDPAQIAAAQGGGSGDNRNAQALADLQNAKTVEGNRSFNSQYAQLVSDIGNRTRTLQVNGEAQQTLTGELENAQQSISGVNLDEERVNLLYYQQMYQANAKVIETAASLFDTLLGIRA